MKVLSLKLKMGWLIGSFMDKGIVSNTAQAIKGSGSGVMEHERVECQVKICVNHR